MIAYARRPGRRTQRGFSLIEALVTIAVVSASVVTLVGALAAAEKDAGTVSRQAHAQVSLRTLADDIRSATVAYRTCNTGSYRSDLQGLAPAGVTVTSVVVERPSATNLPAGTCGDHGLQRLTVTVTEDSSSATAVVWKSLSVSASAAPTPPPGGGG